jgi:hypothetical protein
VFPFIGHGNADNTFESLALEAIFRETITSFEVLVKKFQKKGLLGDLGTEEKVIIKCILNKYGVRMWTIFIMLKV